MREVVLLLFIAIGTSKAIQVGPVRLASGSQYITYQLGASETKSLIECPIVLKPTEVLKDVSWKFYEDSKIVGTYHWNANEGLGQAEGRLRDSVRLDREDGNLELTELRYDLGGFYSCSATTEDDKEGSAAQWEVLIIDMTANSQQEGLINDGPCKFNSTYKRSPTYPEPTLHSGLYSDSAGGFIAEVSSLQWHKTQYPNKSIAYSYEDVSFEINENTPYDVYFLNSFGVNKKDGTFIPLTSSKAVLQRFDDRGCKPVKLDEYQKVEYNNGNQKTCRGEMAAPLTGELKATVSCMKGYKPARHPTVTSVELTCDTETWKWNLPKDELDVSSIKCVIDDSNDNFGSTVSACSALIVACLILVQRFRL